MLASRLLPPLSSVTRFNRNGVTCSKQRHTTPELRHVGRPRTSLLADLAPFDALCFSLCQRSLHCGLHHLPLSRVLLRDGDREEHAAAQAQAQGGVLCTLYQEGAMLLCCWSSIVIPS